MVREREGSRVKIHYHKYPNRYDEWIDIDDKRFAPHKSYTQTTKVSWTN